MSYESFETIRTSYTALLIGGMVLIGYLTLCASYAKYRHKRAHKILVSPFSRRTYTIFYTFAGPFVFTYIISMYMLKLPFVVAEKMSDIVLKD